MRVAVIGGGPAGLMAAASLPSHIQTILVERGAGPGRKLLLSGSGQCNLTHAGGPEDFIPHYGDNGKFLRPALHAFPPSALIEFFSRRGVPAVEREDGKVFPVSGRARDVLAALLAAASGARIVTGARASGLKRKENFYEFSAGGEIFAADRVIIATGGLSYPATGSTGDGLDMARGLGHSITAPKPALRAVLCPGFSALAGNSFPGVGAALYRAGRIVRRSSGDLLFTHSGVSGPLVLDLSRYILEGDLLAVNLLHPRGPEDFIRDFPAIVKDEASRTAGSLLREFPLSRALEDFILTRTGIPRDKRRGDLSGLETRRLAEALVRFPVRVGASPGFEAAMVTAGGVRLGEVNPKTMESRLAPGIFFAGEVLDIDGDSGGYNLQAAFSTGRLAALCCSAKS